VRHCAARSLQYGRMRSLLLAIILVTVNASAIILTSPATEPEWHEAGILIDELIDWDFERFRAQGHERADLVRAFYPDNLEDVRRHCSGADGRFLLARGDGDAAGCASFRRLDAHTCELYNVYVRHSYRGCGSRCAGPNSVTPRL